jgi:hypothetical protein
MDNEEFQRLVLIGIAELVDIVNEAVYGTPYKSLGSRGRWVADRLRDAAGGGEDVQAARIRHAGSR